MVAGMVTGVHNASHQVRLLRDALQSDKVRIGFFLGAGCPLGIYDGKGKKSLTHIPDVAGLTKRVCERLGERDTATNDETSSPLLPLWTKLFDACKDGDVIAPNVEHVLSELRTLCARRGKSDVDGMAKATLAALDEKICDLIAEEVDKPLPGHRCAYHRLASWVGGLQRLAPVELFTSNYDLLLEEALEQQRIPHFDGFVGAREPFFDLASIEQDAIPARWTRVWKLHGSINWQKRDDGGVFRVAGKAATGKAIIYPSHLKYDQSRRMPYLAMLDRLKAFFRPGSHAQGFGPPVIIVCGYSFSDEHLNEVLLDGLRGNRSAQCFALVFDEMVRINHIVKIAEKQPNLSVIARDGAVIGTRISAYCNSSVPSGSLEPWYMIEKPAAPDGSETERLCCRLGDFHYFGLFLEQLCGHSTDENTTPST